MNAADKVAFVITLRPVDVGGAVTPRPARLVTTDENKAKQIVAAKPTHRSLERVTWDQLRDHERENLERAEREAATKQ